MPRRRDLKLYCFSPFVMLATFVVEIVLALYTMFRYKLNEVGRLAVLLLVFLAIFQLAEYAVCEGTGWIDSVLASRIGYVAITVLPPLGIHLAYAIARAKKRPLLWPVYLNAAMFIAMFLLIGPVFSGHACMGNYIIFQMMPDVVWLYALYYYGWLLAGLWLCRHLATASTKRALYGLGIGYLVFLVPTTLVNIIDPETIKGIPSIMCGFAVLLAFTIAFWILPKAGAKR